MREEFDQWWKDHTANSTADTDFLAIAESWAWSAWQESAKRSIASRIKITRVQGTVGTQAILTRLEEF